jgi:hypothetical protein
MDTRTDGYWSPAKIFVEGKNYSIFCSAASRVHCQEFQSSLASINIDCNSVGLDTCSCLNHLPN